MNSSAKQPHDNLATGADTPKWLSALQELANLRDDPASFERFARHWPVLADVLDDTWTPEEAPVAPGRGTVSTTDDDLPTLIFRGFVYGKEPSRMPPSIPKKFLLTWQMREALREIWSGNSDKLTEVLLPSLDEIYADPDPEGLWPPQLKVDWRRGEFVYKPRNLFQGAVYELFRRSLLAKVCANQDCLAPYFIAGKTAQRYCSDGCAQVFQREWKRRWWKEKGTKWRQKKSGGKKGKS